MTKPNIVKLFEKFGGSLISENKIAKITDFIPTGNYILNAQISGSLFGGIPNNKSILIAGESGTGKTFLSLNICREAQKKGYYVIYCDSEAAIELDSIKNFGVNPDMFIYQPVKTIQEFSVVINNFIKSVKEERKKGDETKYIVVLDSLGNLASSNEKNITLEGRDVRDMTKQQAIRSMFRTVTVDLAELEIPFVITNHTYQSMSMFSGQEISGGGGAIFNASVILMLSKAKLKEDEGSENKNEDLKQTGIIVTSTLRKSRFTKPITVRFRISFFNGMNPYVGLEKYISFEKCGVGRGVLLNEKEYEKNSKTLTNVTKIETSEGVFYFQPKDTARNWVVFDSKGVRTVELKKLFSSEVFSDEVLKKLDENVIQKEFKLDSILNKDEGENLIDSGEIDV